MRISDLSSDVCSSDLFGMIGGNVIGNVFQKLRFTGLWLSNDKAALTLPNGGEQVHDPGGIVVRLGHQAEFLIRKKRRQVIKGDPVQYFGRSPSVNGFDPSKRKIFFSFFWRNDVSPDHVAGLERSGARRVGKGFVRTGRSRWSPSQ